MTTKAMAEAKMGKTGIGHHIYEAMQEAQAKLNEFEVGSKDYEKTWLMLDLLKKVSNNYYNSTGIQSNSTASLSGIVEPLQRISAMGAGGDTFSSVYPNVVSLLGRMRQSLPSVEVKKGVSSCLGYTSPRR
ncbi:MAG: hypothetical protein K2H64_12240, partial [Desulfovibrio sp.]|nr:hypothetical protein [Desulfovibrio sp.]